MYCKFYNTHRLRLVEHQGGGTWLDTDSIEWGCAEVGEFLCKQHQFRLRGLVSTRQTGKDYFWFAVRCLARLVIEMDTAIDNDPRASK